MKLAKIALVAVMLLALCLTGCSLANENEGVEELFLVLTEEDFVYLEDYPDLKKLDLTGSTCYDAILQYIEAHPEVEVTYTISLGSNDYPSDTTELTLEPKDFDYDELMAALKYLPDMTHISLPGTALTTEQLDAIAATYPGITVDYSIELLGQIYELDVTELNLSAMKSEDLEEVVAKLPTLSAVTYVELMDESGNSNLTKTDVKTLQDTLPGAVFNYSFDLFGHTVSTADESVEFYDVHIGNEGEQEIREALDILTACTYFKLDDCGIDSTVMASIRDDYPDVKVVWRIYCDYFTMCTDETMVRMTFDLNDENCSELQYCTDVTYIDVGHNSTLTDISFVQYMPKLECVIVSGSPLTDISYFADHDSLTWLELAFCSHLEDISCLDTCDNLKYLNVSYTRVSDVTVLEKLPLERFNAMHTSISSADQKKFDEWHPDCLTRWEGEQPYGYGWRYDDYGYTFFDYYANMRIVFRYDDKSYYGNMKER